MGTILIEIKTTSDISFIEPTQTTKAQISLRIRAGLSAPFLFAHVYCSQPVYVAEQPGLYLNWSDTLKIGYFMMEHGICTDSLRNMTHAS